MYWFNVYDRVSPISRIRNTAAHASHNAVLASISLWIWGLLCLCIVKHKRLIYALFWPTIISKSSCQGITSFNRNQPGQRYCSLRSQLPVNSYWTATLVTPSFSAFGVGLQAEGFPCKDRNTRESSAVIHPHNPQSLHFSHNPDFVYVKVLLIVL